MGLQARVVRSGAGLEEAVAAAQSSSMSATPAAYITLDAARALYGYQGSVQ